MDSGIFRILFWQQSGEIFVVCEVRFERKIGKRCYFVVYSYSKIKKQGNRLLILLI